MSKTFVCRICTLAEKLKFSNLFNFTWPLIAFFAVLGTFVWPLMIFWPVLVVMLLMRGLSHATCSKCAI